VNDGELNGPQFIVRIHAGIHQSVLPIPKGLTLGRLENSDETCTVVVYAQWVRVAVLSLWGESFGDSAMQVSPHFLDP